ncbi:MAG TPA: ribose-5-phosphate isomerase RpiA [Dehalococcoidia bacterium]|nr:ribose-5-phosphate isomerase RpiA [Dehalococcoidia bacterium]
MAEAQTALKQAAAVVAVRAEVRDGMRLGLGTGSTAFFVLEELARRIREEGLRVSGVPTSLETARLARERGIPLLDLEEPLDVAIDGADEIGPRRALTKGGGGAMTREKCVALAARRFVIVADASKLVRRLSWPVPVEVLPFAEGLVLRTLRERLAGAEPRLRLVDGAPFLTDNGNHIIDVGFGGQRLPPARLGRAIRQIPGVVEHGLFVDMRPVVYVAGDAGVRVIR